MFGIDQIKRGGDEPAEENKMSEVDYTNFFLASNGKLDVIKPNSY